MNNEKTENESQEERKENKNNVKLKSKYSKKEYSIKEKRADNFLQAF